MSNAVTSAFILAAAIVLDASPQNFTAYTGPKWGYSLQDGNLQKWNKLTASQAQQYSSDSSALSVLRTLALL